MKIHLDYRNPTPSHCDVAVFVDGAHAGVLTLRQSELLPFQMILHNGLLRSTDTFTAAGNPDPAEGGFDRPVDLLDPPWKQAAP